MKEIYAFCAPPLGEIGDLRERVIAIAKGELGKPYLFEDTAYPLDPAAHNCSTLVQYVTHQAGIIAADGTSVLPAPSQVQWAIFSKRGGAVRAVSYFDAAQRGIEPGDVVFFVGGLAQVGSQMPPAHVGIYVGDGVYIHAPRTGLPVMESRLSDRADLWGYGDLDCLAGGGGGL
ncbi:MAG: peptidoglycan endopeptidase [Desulforudis sp.]|nr:MAG: peptidoglycan endopeptidase [Desulforudis sp.]